jgi:CRISPR system Cascade subunit CasA
MMNLLTDPVFRVRTPEGLATVSLPELLALLGEDRVESLPGLQRHQEDAFHIFCCYLAGAVLVRQGEVAPRQTAAFWLKGIRALTRQEGCEDDSAWTLIVEDPTKPAFMQPPVSNKTVFERDYKPKAATPDALDVLQTARNHDVKSSRGSSAQAEQWVLALISLNGTVGYVGAGNYGIARMNGGFGSRACVGWKRTTRAGDRFIHDVGRLIHLRDSLLMEPYPYSTTGSVLTWLSAWDGEKSRSLSCLDPFFIETPRRVRMHHDRAIQCLGATSRTAQVAADQLNGSLGDPWTPVKAETNESFTPNPSGFTPQLLRDILFSDGFAAAPMMIADRKSGWVALTARIRERRKGNPEGFHEATIRVPAAAQPLLFGGGAARDRLASLSKRGLDDASDIRQGLRNALFSLMEGGPEKINYDADQISKWVDNSARLFLLNWSPRFFDWLWTTVGIANDTEALRPWFNELRRLAQETLDRAAERAPQRHGRSYRAKTKAQGEFDRKLRTNFPHFMEVTHDEP